ncbi:MAG: hypothetical protein ACJAXA_003102 [Candidatus Aldehydirespiratoraceae bacterium]|jgi:hypothetical protein
MEPQTSNSTITIDASAAQVWKVLADEFVDIAAWSPGVKSSGPNPATPEGINGSRYGGRVADIEGLGLTDVRITEYDAQNLTLSYTVEAENIPGFIERITNTWTVTADSPKSSSLTALVGITIGESMSTNEQANKAVEAMLAAGTGAASNLKTYIESDTFQADVNRG